MTERHTVRGVQVLRGLAACMVVVHHSTQRFASLTSGHALLFWENGASGVDIFFVISGFVMAVSTLGHEDKRHPAFTFLKRRFIRLVPLYWAMTLLFILLTLYLRQHHSGEAADIQVHTRITWSTVLSSFSFIPYRSPLGIQPILAVGWTLSYEVLFYLLFAAALALRVSVVGLLTPALVLLALIGVFRSPTWPAFTVLADPLLLEFLAGLLLGYCRLKGYRGSSGVSFAFGLLAMGCLLLLPTAESFGLRALMWGLPAFLIVHAIVVLEPRWGQVWPPWMLLIGDASYSLYLSHNMVMNFLYTVLVKLHLAGAGHTSVLYEVMDAILCLLITLLVSLVLYWFVEKPMIAFLKRRSIARPLWQ